MQMEYETDQANLCKKYLDLLGERHEYYTNEKKLVIAENEHIMEAGMLNSEDQIFLFQGSESLLEHIFFATFLFIIIYFVQCLSRESRSLTIITLIL